MPSTPATGFYPVRQTPLSVVGGQGALPIPEEYSASQILRHEIELLGFPLSLHPLQLYRSVLEKIQYVPAIDMGTHVGRAVTMIGLLITEKMAQTRDGNPMEFITLEDTTALYDATLFPAVYRRVCQLLTPNQPYLLRGRVEEAFGAATLTVDDLRRLNDRSPAPLLKEHSFTADAMLSFDHGEDAEFA
jgi:error-prone DNA polymerase